MSVSTREHLEALREADQRAVNIANEAAKEARQLARDAQKYRDEQANKLREQIESERGLYVTVEQYNDHIDGLSAQIAALKETVSSFISGDTSSQSTRSSGARLFNERAGWLVALAVLVLYIIHYA